MAKEPMHSYPAPGTLTALGSCCIYASAVVNDMKRINVAENANYKFSHQNSFPRSQC